MGRLEEVMHMRVLSVVAPAAVQWRGASPMLVPLSLGRVVDTRRQQHHQRFA